MRGRNRAFGSSARVPSVDPKFVHLHVHSEYSLLDGANKIGDLVTACQKDGQRALALTDHGNMFGAIELYQAASKAGVKPIVGCEVYIARQSRKEPHSKAKGNGYHHLTLMASDLQLHLPHRRLTFRLLIIRLWCKLGYQLPLQFYRHLLYLLRFRQYFSL